MSEAKPKSETLQNNLPNLDQCRGNYTSVKATKSEMPPGLLRDCNSHHIPVSHQAFAAADDRNQQILPFQTITTSTIPSNGDVNPYGVAFVPQDFPAGGLLNPGDLLVSNFNNAQNIQGTGTTIIKVTPTGQTSLFFQGTAPLGLSTGLEVLKAGFVLVANCPTNSTPPVPGALPGSLLLIDSHGKLVETITNPVIQGPWDFTVQDEGKQSKGIRFECRQWHGVQTRLFLEWQYFCRAKRGGNCFKLHA